MIHGHKEWSDGKIYVVVVLVLLLEDGTVRTLTGST